MGPDVAIPLQLETESRGLCIRGAASLALKLCFDDKIVAGVILVEILLAVGTWVPGVSVQMFDVLAGAPEGMTNTQWIGSVLYTRYLFVFQASGLVLLVSMIGAIVLTHRQRVGTKRQNIAAQVARTPANAVHTAQPGIGQGVEL